MIPLATVTCFPVGWLADPCVGVSVGWLVCLPVGVPAAGVVFPLVGVSDGGVPFCAGAVSAVVPGDGVPGGWVELVLPGEIDGDGAARPVVPVDCAAFEGLIGEGVIGVSEW